MEALSMGVLAIIGNPKLIVMWIIGGILIYFAVKHDYEPALLLPIGFGSILTNIPYSSAVGEHGPLTILLQAGIMTELFPVLIFIAIGAMCDFQPLIRNPVVMLYGAAAQFGIFATIVAAAMMGFSFREAASIGIIGAADGPTTIYVATRVAKDLLGPLSVAAYSYMALVPIIQPPIIKLLTTEKERKIRMDYEDQEPISSTARLLFPIMITLIAGIIAPISVALIGTLMFGNLIRESGVLDNLSNAAQNELAHLVTLLLGITIGTTMEADKFLTKEVAMVMSLGLVAFIFDTAAGVLFAKLFNFFLSRKINPMIGACGISAFPMSARVVAKLALKEDPSNFIIMHAIGVNASGQIGSVVAGGLVLALVT